MGTALLKAKDLSRQLGPRLLWQRLGFELRPGDRLALVAPTGAGKSLLLRALAQLDPLESGSIELRGRSPSQWTLPLYRSRVILLSQRVAVFPGTVEHNLRRVLAFASHRRRSFERERLLGWLTALGRDGSFLDQPADHLSGGECQLLALLRALQLDPEILLLDEPTASLDATTTSQVEALLHAWLSGGERACLFTSHDAAQIARFGDRRLELGP